MNETLHPIFAELLKNMERTMGTRSARLMKLEDDLVDIGLDAFEAHDFLGAFKVALRKKYEEDDLTDVLALVDKVKVALDEVEYEHPAR